VETGDVGINIDFCTTCAGQRSGAAQAPISILQLMQIDCIANDTGDVETGTAMWGSTAIVV
jgi:hypothetical protein